MSSVNVIIDTTIFAGIFLTVTALVQTASNRWKFPYTVALLVIGFVAQLAAWYWHWPVSVTLPPDVIYFILLPLLLYESAFHINVHQFQLQFKTITFMATFGLLTAISVVAACLTFWLGLSWVDSLLFGALISATDPIAVLALFKELGAPKRLGLLAEGESMFNDATAVIAFRMIAAFAITGVPFTGQYLLASVGNFLYVFVGSLLFGAAAGYVMAMFIARINNDRLVETTLTIALALLVFIGAEHSFHLSGVIATVAAGIVMGNSGRTKISSGVINFMQEFWEYVSFVSVSLVFFFASFTLDINTVIYHPLTLGLVIIAVLLSRSLSTYVTFAITNRWRLFANEPNVPLSWQHILNWGGLRGVIPLVLVYSLPEEYGMRQEFLAYTLSVFLFTLLINATTISALLRKLGLHLPAKEEQIIAAEEDIFSLEEAKKRVRNLSKGEFPPHIVHEVISEIDEQEQQLKKMLRRLVTPMEFEKSLRLAVLDIERRVVHRLFTEGHVNENIVFTFLNELDLQQDALEYAQLRTGRGYAAGGFLRGQEAFWQRINRLRRWITRFPLLGRWLMTEKVQLVEDRLSLLQARVVASSEALEYLQRVADLTDDSQVQQKVITRVVAEHEQFRLKNNFQIQELERQYPRVYHDFERATVRRLAAVQSSRVAGH